MTEEKKVLFASPASVEIARGVLEHLVSEHGQDGQTFSICETFADAPSEITVDRSIPSIRTIPANIIPKRLPTPMAAMR